MTLPPYSGVVLTEKVGDYTQTLNFDCPIIVTYDALLIQYSGFNGATSFITQYCGNAQRGSTDAVADYKRIVLDGVKGANPYNYSDTAKTYASELSKANKKKISIDVYESFMLEVTDGKKPLSGLKFTSDKPKIASVDKKTGLITGLKAGKAVITVKAANGVKVKCNVTVKAQK